MLDILQAYHSAFLAGLLETLKITISAWCLGVTIGFLLSYYLHLHRPDLISVLKVTGFTIANIPVIVILMWAYYPMQTLIGVNISGTLTTIIVLTTVNAVGVSQIITEAMAHFPRELIYSARTLGVHKRDIFIWIQIPIVLREVIPTILNLQIAIMHMTLFASLLSAGELFRTAQRIIAQTYTPIAVYSALAFFFIIIGIGVQLLVIFWKRYTRIFEIGELEC